MNNTIKFGLEPKTIEALKAIFIKHQQIKKVLLYGSRAKGNYKNGSDIDLALVAPTLTFTELLKIENEIDDLMLPYKVDLALYHLIENIELIKHIDRVGIEL